MVTVRQLTVADGDTLVAFRRSALATNPEAFGSTLQEFDNEKSKELYKQRLEASKPGAENLVFMAFDDDDTPLGMVGLHRPTRLKTRHTASVWGMFVAQEGRGKGIGRQLMTTLIETAKNLEGVEQLNLSVITENPAARHLYQKLGFEEYGIEPCALKQDGYCYDMVYMLLKLSALH